MDPLSIAAGVAGLINLTLQVTQSIASYGKAAKREAHDVEQLMQELESTLAVLRQLDSFVRSTETTNLTFHHASTLEIALSRCDKIVLSLQQRLRNLSCGKVLRTIERLAWPFSAKEMHESMEGLRRCTSTFQFALTVEGWSVENISLYYHLIERGLELEDAIQLAKP